MYTYLDSIAGLQTKKFEKLSEIIKYIEDFGHHSEKESSGCVYFNETPIIMYTSSGNGVFWDRFEC